MRGEAGDGEAVLSDTVVPSDSDGDVVSSGGVISDTVIYEETPEVQSDTYVPTESEGEVEGVFACVVHLNKHLYNIL